jgi:hypothetical protein
VQGCDLDLQLTLLASTCSNVATSQIKLVHISLSFCCKYCMCLAWTLPSNWTSHDQVMAGLQSVSFLACHVQPAAVGSHTSSLPLQQAAPTQRFLHTTA